MNFKNLLVAVAAGFAFVTGAAHAQTPAQWDQVVAAAKKEGKLIFYSAQVGYREHPDVIKLFEAKYGIKVDLFEARNTELAERMRVEIATGRPSGDLLIQGSTGVVPLQQAGMLQGHGPFPNESKLVLKPWIPEEVPVHVLAYGMLVNTNLVKPGDEPKSWKDLATNPMFKGKILADEFHLPGGGNTWFQVMLANLGEGFHEQLAKQEITFSRNIAENPRRVARGEFAVSLPFNMANLAGLDGTPIKGIMPVEGVAYTPVSVSMIKGAVNTNAALLMMNFFLEPEAQVLYQRSGYPIAIAGVEDKTPSKWKIDPKLLGHADLAKTDERMAIAAKIYNRPK